MILEIQKKNIIPFLHSLSNSSISNSSSSIRHLSVSSPILNSKSNLYYLLLYFAIWLRSSRCLQQGHGYIAYDDSMTKDHRLWLHHSNHKSWFSNLNHYASLNMLQSSIWNIFFYCLFLLNRWGLAQVMVLLVIYSSFQFGTCFTNCWLALNWRCLSFFRRSKVVTLIVGHSPLFHNFRDQRHKAVIALFKFCRC